VRKKAPFLLDLSLVLKRTKHKPQNKDEKMDSTNKKRASCSEAVGEDKTLLLSYLPPGKSKDVLLTPRPRSTFFALSCWAGRLTHSAGAETNSKKNVIETAFSLSRTHSPSRRVLL